jgi:HEAT repeat protein
MRTGSRRLAAVPILVSLLAAQSSALAQAPGETARDRLRDRYSPGRDDSANISDAARKLRSENLTERLEGIRVLAGSSDPKSVDYLLAAASDADIRVRVKAIDELGNRRVSDATPLFVQQLFLRETDPAIQQRVLAALGKIGDPRSTKPICDFLSRDLDPSLRGTAIFALGEIGDKTALDVLTKLAANATDPVTSRLADEAARKITHRPPRPVELPSLAEDRGR